MKSKPKVQNAIQKIESDIESLASKKKKLVSGKQSDEAEKMKKLKKIATSLEDIDSRVDNLMEKQAKKKIKKNK